ncbi:MAG: hypothetical protein H6924_07405 [Alphaproteobacteria bacterium]|nr:hypothetical protein [Alphaproteobacteria bacterium]
MMAMPLVLLPLLGTAAQAAPSSRMDTMCEATMTALADNARAHGQPSAALSKVAYAAHASWLRSHPDADAGVYRTAQKVRAASIRQAMHDGRITLADTMSRMVACHTRYEGANQMVASLD